MGRLRQTGCGFEAGGGREQNPSSELWDEARAQKRADPKDQAGAGGDLQLKDTEPSGVEGAAALRSGQPPNAQLRGSVSAAPARPPQPWPRAPCAGMKLAAAVMSPRGAEEAEGPPGSPVRLV